MRIFIYTFIAVLLAIGIEQIPGTASHEGRQYDVPKKIEKISQLPHVELASKETKPVYCADYVKKYDWNQTVAYNVMMVESGNKARNLNDNPSTGDYSVGCFQINLLGGNQTAKYNLAVSLGYTGANDRQALTEWLWNPANNVAVAHVMWKGQGWQPWSFTTCKKVACY